MSNSKVIRVQFSNFQFFVTSHFLILAQVNVFPIHLFETHLHS